MLFLRIISLSWLYMNQRTFYIFFRLFFCCTLALLSVSCSVTKYVPEGQYLLDQVDIRTNAPGMKSAELETYLTQQPNFRVFGMTRLRLATYSLSGRDTTKRRNRWLRRMGEPPVLYDEYQTLRSDKKLEQYFKTKGYLNAEVYDSVVYDGKKAKVIYLVEENIPYRIRNISFDFHNDTLLGNLVKRNKFTTTKLVSGNLFDTDVLNEERDRLTNIARRNGYYYFTKDYVSYIADSSLRSYQVDLTLLLKPYTVKIDGGEVEEMQHPRYTIGNVNVLTLPVSSATVKPMESYSVDSIASNVNLYYEKRPLLRPKMVRNNLRIIPGMWYNSGFVNQTYNRFSGFGIIRSAEISFRDPKTEDHQLECNVVLAPNKAHTFSLDVEGTNSSGDLGAAVTGMLQHRNLFHGSELLTFKARGACEEVTGKAGDLQEKLIWEFDASTSLTFPQFVFPFLSSNFRRRVNNSQTEFALSYNDQRRWEYDRRIFTASDKYSWTAHRFYSYTIDALNVNYVDLHGIDNKFWQRYQDPKYSVLLESYNDHLIVSSGATMVYDNQSSKLRLDKQMYKLSLEFAGNTLYGLGKACGFEQVLDTTTNSMRYAIAGVPFAQYIKGSGEYAYNKYIDEKNRIVFHGRLGVEVPFGNATTVPFEKRFFGGGANGVRGWSVRTLGPGSALFDKEDFVSQSGNIELTLNAEYRSKLFWIMEGAAFIDAGNIWNIRDYDFAPGGVFRFDKFWKQIALAYGLGVRFDFTYFLCRFDVGMKCYDPKDEPGRDKWRYTNIRWKDDFALHFAIGYPF